MRNQNVTSFKPASSEDIHKHRKENHFYKEIALIDCTSKATVASIRFYGTQAVSYCCAWFWFPWEIEGATTARGSAKASGYGYHRPSAAMFYALQEAGFSFDNPFDGVGDSAMREAVDAIAKHLKLTNYMIHEAHA